ncbi:MAG: SDR family NAD(P)-dependent oxidoreductase [Ignavibacteriae bacterium]|nr:SDR family NAD(P)-dependent oxidoreductase [Ignavibacteriota bacterium]
MKTALVTGGSGFIGSHLVELLLQKGYAVRCLLRKTSSTAWLKDLPITVIQGDVYDEQALAAAVAGVDYIYHSAGLTKAKEKSEYYRANAGGTRNLLQAAIRHAPNLSRFVQISSQTAAGPSPTATPITEDQSGEPITTYGKSKLQAEKECLALLDKLPITIVRPPAVFGPRDKDVFEFFATMQKGLQPVVGFGEKYVTLIHVKDLVRGIVMAGESPNSVGKTYFIGSKKTYGWKEVGQLTRKALGRGAVTLRVPEAGVYVIAAFAEFFSLFSSKPALINFEKARDMVQDYWTCDSAKAKRDFGYEQEITLEAGINDTIAWCRQQGWLK